MYHQASSLDLQFLKGFAFFTSQLGFEILGLPETKDTLWNWPSDQRSWDWRGLGSQKEIWDCLSLKIWNLDCANRSETISKQQHVNNVPKQPLNNQYTLLPQKSLRQWHRKSPCSGVVTRTSFRAEFPEASYTNWRAEHLKDGTVLMLGNDQCPFNRLKHLIRHHGSISKYRVFLLKSLRIPPTFSSCRFWSGHFELLALWSWYWSSWLFFDSASLLCIYGIGRRNSWLML